MDAGEIYNGLAKAVEAARPAQEYCFLWFPHWSTCMTKSEWTGALQAFFSVLSICIAAAIPYYQEYWQNKKRILAARFVLPRVGPKVQRYRGVYTEVMRSIEKAESYADAKLRVETYLKQLSLNDLPGSELLRQIESVDLKTGLGYRFVDALNKHITSVEFVRILFKPIPDGNAVLENNLEIGREIFKGAVGGSLADLEDIYSDLQKFIEKRTR